MNKEELMKYPLLESKEFKSSLRNKKLNNRKIYWSFRNKIFLFDYLCPKTNRIWLRGIESEGSNSQDTNAITEMYLLP